jgi:hypothetical protein
VTPLTFDTKVAVVLESELALWQKVNVTAFLLSGFAAADPSLVGAPYVDASGNEYLPMLRQPNLVYAGDAASVRRAYERTLAREVDQFAIFTRTCSGHRTTRRTGQPSPLFRRLSSISSASPSAAHERRSTRSSTSSVRSHNSFLSGTGVSWGLTPKPRPKRTTVETGVSHRCVPSCDQLSAPRS